MQYSKLSDREKAILRYVIHQFILTASPVGSRNIAKKYELGLSPATIRNIMADLEDSGYLEHPHTSAGRKPTDKGYRFYVDSISEIPLLNPQQKSFINKMRDSELSDTEKLIRVTSILLSDLTKQLACITYPSFKNSILKKIQLIPITSSRILVVISIQSGFAKTITLEINSEIKEKCLFKIEMILNEKLSGLSFTEIKDSINERMNDSLEDDLKPIVRVFLDSSDKIFTESEIGDKSIITGAKNILQQPEFEDHDSFSSIIELIEDRDIIIHIKEQATEFENIKVSIGSENVLPKLSEYSMITKEYKLGGISGKVGIIGPRRMEYSKAIAAVTYVAEQLSNELKRTSL